jgi:hypothetical protein
MADLRLIRYIVPRDVPIGSFSNFNLQAEESVMTGFWIAL